MVKSGDAWSVDPARQRSRASAKTGQLIRVCAPTLSIWVRMAPSSRARRRERRLNSMRAATSAALQLAERSSIAACERAREIPDRVALAPPDMALVDMGVDVDEERQHDAPRQCDFRRVAEVDGAGGRDLRDCALVDEDVDDREAVKVERA